MGLPWLEGVELRLGLPLVAEGLGLGLGGVQWSMVKFQGEKMPQRLMRNDIP